MPITFECPCGKSLRVADEHAGRRVKCPACGAVVPAPKPQPPTEPADAGEEPQFEVIEKGPHRARPATRATAPDDDDYGEPRSKRAKRDRDDDDEPRRKKKKRRRAPAPAYRDDYGRGADGDMTGVDWALCIFCPGIGCIVGLVRLISGSGAGGKMVAISLMFAVAWNVLRFALAAATK